MTAASARPDSNDGPSRRRARGQAAGASLIVGLAAAGIPMVAGGAPVHAEAVLAGAGIVALLAALLGRAPGFTFAALALAGEYSLRLVSRHGLDRLDGVAVLEAVALFTTVELGLRSLDARTIARPERAVRRAASWRLVGMVAGAGASAFVVLAVGSRRLPAPTAGLALGLAAAAALLLSADLLRRRATRVARVTAANH
jgi:hypothetical protein